MLSCLVAGRYPVPSVNNPDDPFVLVKYDENYTEDENTMLLV